MTASRASRGAFDVEGFYRALDVVRDARGLSFRELAREAEVSPSALTRMQKGRCPGADGLAALARWGGISLDAYVVGVQMDSEKDVRTRIRTLVQRDDQLPHLARRWLDAVVRVVYAEFVPKKEKQKKESRR